MNVPILGEIIINLYVVPVMLPRSQSEDFVHPERFLGWEDKFREQLEKPGFSRAILSSIRNLPNIDVVLAYEELAKTGHRVLLVWGRGDKSVSFEDVMTVVEAIPSIEFHKIDEAAHLAHYERPDVVNPILLEFLKRP